jgi:hypothetical protein
MALGRHLGFSIGTKCIPLASNTRRAKVFGCAQIIPLLNTEQNCGWVDLNLESNPDLTCFTSSSVVEALMNS